MSDQNQAITSNGIAQIAKIEFDDNKNSSDTLAAKQIAILVNLYRLIEDMYGCLSRIEEKLK